MADRHPIIEQYIRSPDDLLESLQKYPEPRGPLLTAMLRLRESLAGITKPEDALAEAAALPRSGHDPDLYLLFLGLWSYASVQKGKLEETEAILKRGESLADENSVPELRVMLLATRGIFESYRGNKIGRLEGLQRALDLLDPNSKRANGVLFDRALFLAQMGRLGECSDDLVRLEEAARESPVFAQRVAMIRFTNAAEVGDLEEADKHDKGLDALAHGLLAARVIVSMGRTIVRLMRGEFEPEEMPAGEKPVEVGGYTPWALSAHALLQGNTDEALRWARSEADALASSRAWIGFAGYALIRAELAAGNAGAALRLLSWIRLRGTRHYIDHLYLARLELLFGNRDAAARHFAKTLHAVERYGAQGRLDFELRLAAELSPGTLVDLTRAALAADGKSSDESIKDASVEITPPTPGPPVPDRGVARLVGPSPALGSVRSLVKRLAEHAAPVLIRGETGTGKEMVARALHEESPCRDEPFIVINCGAISESLLESELFGHEKGAFTGAGRARRGILEEAGKGTVLLDEIGEITPRLQVVLLRFLETGEIRPVGASRPRKTACRILAATNQNLEKMVKEGRFRKDLLFRLKRLEIKVPPLKERKRDILPLAGLFLSEDRRDNARPLMSEDLKARLLAHKWPGNVRELRNAMERMRLLNSDKLAYEAADLGLDPSSSSSQITTVPEKVAQPKESAGDKPDTAKKAAPKATTAEEVLSSEKTRMRRLERLKKLFLEHRRLTRSEIVKIMKLSPTTVTKDLAALGADGFIEKVMPSASPRSHYFRLK